MTGTINSSTDIAIGQTGSFEGEIRAKRVLVSGKFDGTLDADCLEIVATGQVKGEIRVRELVIEPGGQFSGVSHVKQGNEEQPRRLTHTTESSDRVATIDS